MSNIALILTTSSGTYDISQLVSSIKWSGRKSASARTLQVTILDDDGSSHTRADIKVDDGNQVIFKYNGNELFRGMIMKTEQSLKKQLTFTAYDNGIYLANNKDTFVYKNKTADEIFRDCCQRFGMPIGEVSKCDYVIPDLTKPGASAFDAICDALSLDFDNTGTRHYVTSNNGKLSLLTRRENILQWVIEPKNNLTGYTYSQSVENIITRVKITSKEDTTVAVKTCPDLESKLGVFQEVKKADEALSSAQITELAESVLNEKAKPTRNLRVDALGIPEVISGIGVYILINHLGLSRTFYVDQDTHTFKDNSHTMSLTLNYASDLEAPKKTNSAGSDFNVGDIVNFNGGNHYVSSCETTPAGGMRSGGKAKITVTASGAKHPYHLIGGAFNEVGGSCNVYGWVDAGTFSK